MTEYTDSLALAKRMSNDILSEIGNSISLSVPIPIRRVAEMYVGDVEITSIPFRRKLEGISAFTRKDMERGWLIVLDASEPWRRRRFSLAHELGHIVLFPERHDPVFHNSKRRDWKEKMCNRFAGDILMPDDLVRAYYWLHHMPFVESVAEYFDVSPSVAGIQLEHLRLPFKKRFNYSYF